MSADKAKTMQNLVPIGMLRSVHAAEATALKGFVQYLTGFRGAGRPMSQRKMAVVKTQSYTLLLEQEANNAALECWVLQ